MNHSAIVGRLCLASMKDAAIAAWNRSDDAYRMDDAFVAATGISPMVPREPARIVIQTSRAAISPADVVWNPAAGIVGAGTDFLTGANSHYFIPTLTLDVFQPCTPWAFTDFYLPGNAEVSGEWIALIGRIKALPHGLDIAARISELIQEEGEEAPERKEPINIGSLESFELSLRVSGVQHAPIISTSPQGNLYGKWNIEGRVIGIEFLPQSMISYAIVDQQSARVVQPIQYGVIEATRLGSVIGAFKLEVLVSR